MARLKEVSYGRKVSVDFSSRSLILTAEVESGDDVAKVYAELKKTVDEQLNGNSMKNDSAKPINTNAEQTQSEPANKQVNSESDYQNNGNNGNGYSPATIPQLNFLKKFGQKNLILIGLSKTEASNLIQKIKANWKH